MIKIQIASYADISLRWRGQKKRTGTEPNSGWSPFLYLEPKVDIKCRKHGPWDRDRPASRSYMMADLKKKIRIELFLDFYAIGRTYVNTVALLCVDHRMYVRTPLPPFIRRNLTSSSNLLHQQNQLNISRSFLFVQHNLTTTFAI